MRLTLAKPFLDTKYANPHRFKQGRAVCLYSELAANRGSCPAHDRSESIKNHPEVVLVTIVAGHLWFYFLLLFTINGVESPIEP